MAVGREENHATAKDSFANAKPASGGTLAEGLFDVWEKRTSEYCERLLRNPTFLNAAGSVMTAGYKNKALFDKTLNAVWKNLNLPTKRDQERTLHLLNELNSRILDLEEKLAKAAKSRARQETHAVRDL